MKHVRANFARKKIEDHKAARLRVRGHKAQISSQEREKMRRQRDIKKQVFRALSKMDKAKQKSK